MLAHEIKKIVDAKSKFADWTNRTDIKADLKNKVLMLLYNNNYPIEWGEEVFVKIVEQSKILEYKV